MKNIRIIFIGSTSFSLESLKYIINNKYKVVGIITTPDIKKSKINKENPIKKFALLNNLKVLQPNNLQDKNFLKSLKDLNADLQIVVAFKLLPECIWSMPILGTFNLHPSLLPQYRGPAPIHWPIINGEKITGVTTFIIDKNIDTGMIILQEKVYIKNTDYFGDLYKILSKKGALLVIKTIEKYINNNIILIKQKSKKEIKYAPKIFNIDCRINWNDSIYNIYNKIRGLSPNPAAWTILSKYNNKDVNFKIFKINLIIENHNYSNGRIIIESSKIKVCVKKGYILIIEGQIAGKKKLNIKDIINGIKNKNNLFFI